MKVNGRNLCCIICERDFPSLYALTKCCEGDDE